MWVKLSQLHKSKFIKCFLIAIVLVFSYEVSKPKAFVPLGWAAAVLVGMAAETLVTMGVKAGSKAVLKSKAKSYSDEMARTGQFDFTGANPYRNKDGSITLTPSANDRAKMAGLIAGGLTGLAFESSLDDGKPSASCLPSVSGDITGVEYLPFKDHLQHINWEPSDMAVYSTKFNYARAMTDAYFYFDETGNSRINIVSAFDGVVLVNADVSSESSDGLFYTMNGYSTAVDATSVYLRIYKESELNPGTYVAGQTANFNGDSLGYLGASVGVADELGESLTFCDELIVPSTIDNVYQPPMNMSSAYAMPNNDALANQPITIYNVLPPSEEEGEITFAELDKYYADNSLDADVVVDGNLDTYLEKGDAIQNQYTVEEINNIYTDTNYDIKVDDLKPDIDETPAVPDDNLPAEPVDGLDHSMWQVMRNTYNYLDDGIDSSLTAMKGITDSAQGVTSYLNQTMGWLPPEWRAVFTSAFVLGVFAHFLRR